MTKNQSLLWLSLRLAVGALLRRCAKTRTIGTHSSSMNRHAKLPKSYLASPSWTSVRPCSPTCPIRSCCKGYSWSLLDDQSSGSTLSGVPSNNWMFSSNAQLPAKDPGCRRTMLGWLAGMSKFPELLACKRKTCLRTSSLLSSFWNVATCQAWPANYGRNNHRARFLR